MYYSKSTKKFKWCCEPQQPIYIYSTNTLGDRCFCACCTTWCLLGFALVGIVTASFIMGLSYPSSWYDGNCTVVGYFQDPHPTGKGYYQGYWAVNYRTDGDDPLITNTERSIGEGGANTYQIKLNERYQIEEFYQALDQHPINSSAPCKIEICDTDQCNDADRKIESFVAKEIVWMEDWTIWDGWMIASMVFWGIASLLVLITICFWCLPPLFTYPWIEKCCPPSCLLPFIEEQELKELEKRTNK